MSALAFDTHVAVKKLQEAGFTEQQAEAQTALLMDVIAGEVATKRDIEAVKLDIENVRAELKRDIEAVRRDIEAVKLDIENVRAELKRDIETLRTELKHDIVELRRDMKEQELRLTIKLGAMLAIAVGAVATLVKLL
jgi:uncharacterized protein YwgA